MRAELERRIADCHTDREFEAIAKEIIASPPDHSIMELRFAEYILRHRVPPDGKTFEEDLKHLINRRSMENGSDTPDFALAGYLTACLDAYGKAVRERDRWFNYDPWASHAELDDKK